MQHITTIDRALKVFRYSKIGSVTIRGVDIHHVGVYRGAIHVVYTCDVYAVASHMEF